MMFVVTLRVGLPPADCTVLMFGADAVRETTDVRQARPAELPCHMLVGTVETPRDIPPHLYGAFRVVGLPWPDARLGHFDGLLAELGERPGVQELRNHVGMLRKIQDAFFEHLRDLAEEHDGDTMRLIRHKDQPCVTEVREEWAETAARIPEYHAAVATFARQLLGDPPAVPDYLADVLPAWVEARPERGVRGEPTAGREPAADALLRWREDPYGPRICVVAGSPASGKTRLLAWFSGSGVWDWSGYQAPSEAAVCLRGWTSTRPWAKWPGNSGSAAPTWPPSTGPCSSRWPTFTQAPTPDACSPSSSFPWLPTRTSGCSWSAAPPPQPTSTCRCSSWIWTIRVPPTATPSPPGTPRSGRSGPVHR